MCMCVRAARARGRPRRLAPASGSHRSNTHGHASSSARVTRLPVRLRGPWCTSRFSTSSQAPRGWRGEVRSPRSPQRALSAWPCSGLPSLPRMPACRVGSGARRAAPSPPLLLARVVVRVGRHLVLEGLFRRKALPPPGAGGVAHVARLEPVPLDEVEDEAAPVLQLPHRGLVVRVRAHVDAHVQLFVEQRRRRADRHAEVRGPHLDAEVARRRALGHPHLEVHHRGRLPPAVRLRLPAKALLREPRAVDVRPERRQGADARRLVLGLDHLAHQVGHRRLRLLVRTVVARLVVGERLVVCVEPERVA
mmetsp:Transcript_21948/g.71934  ORF Transcript_21948/g.71934 Transcript_21948/m.71934 type:complete len:307 (-) Transcript_21948:514-1434(-)